MNKILRVSKDQITVIKDRILKYDKHAKIFLFGSRTDDNKKGGDIDILVISDKIGLKQEIEIQVELSNALLDFPIDLVIKNGMEDSFVKVIHSEMRLI